MASSTSIRPAIGRVFQSSSRQYPTLCLLLPSRSPSSSSAAPFSTSAVLLMRKPRRDNNRLRGLSAIHRSGTKGRKAIDGFEVPEPAKYKPEEDVKVDPEHGLYQFFYDKERALLSPEEDAKHGRSWTVEELRHKSWDDLHRLWWVCVKERNRIATASRERRRLDLKTGDDQSKERMHMVSKTMKTIKQALTERYYTWEDARTLAKTDPEVDLANDGNPYTPRDYLEDDLEALEADGQVTGDDPQQIQQSITETIDPTTLPKTPEVPSTTRP